MDSGLKHGNKILFSDSKTSQLMRRKKLIGELTLPTRQSAEWTAWPVSIELNLLLQDEDPFDVLIVLSTGSEA